MLVLYFIYMWSSLLRLLQPLTPKKDFGGIRLPNKNKSTEGQALLCGIFLSFLLSFLRNTRKV